MSITRWQKYGVIADKICAMLESDGIPCWIAPRDIHEDPRAGRNMTDDYVNSQLQPMINAGWRGVLVDSSW